MSKLSIEEFKNIKEKMLKIYNNVEDSESEESQLVLVSDYMELQDRLLSFDLSDIQFEEWRGIILYTEGELDLSKTHANIDFSLLEGINYKTINIDGCNVKGIEMLHYDENTFDEEFKKKHSEYFPDESLPQDIKKLFYDKQIQFIHIFKYPLLRKCVREENFYYLCSSKGIIEAIGYDNCMKLFDENPAFVSTITYGTSGISPNSAKKNNFGNNSSYEDAKMFLYQIIIENAENEYFFTLPSFDIFPKDFIEMFPSTFVEDVGIPVEVKEHYYSGNLKISEIRKYADVLRGKNIKIGTKKSFILNSIIEVFDNIWNYIGQVPQELDNAVSNYIKRLNRDELTNIKEKDINTIIENAIREEIAEGNNYYSLEELYVYSKYVPLNEICFNKKMLLLIQILGFDNIIEFNRKNNYILDCNIDISYGENIISSSLLEYISKYVEMIEEDIIINNLEDLNHVFEKIIHQMRENKDYNYKAIFNRYKRELSIVFPTEFLDYNQLDVLLANYDEKQKEVIIAKVESAYDGNIEDLFDVVSNYPKLKKIFDNKKLILKSSSYLFQIFIDELGNNKFLNIWYLYGNVIKYALESRYKIYNIKEFTDYLNSTNNVEQIINELIYNFMIFDNKKRDNTFSLRKMPQIFKDTYPECFLNESAPEELQNLFYQRQICPRVIKEHPEWVTLLLEKDMNFCCVYNLISFLNSCKKKGLDNKVIINLFIKYGDCLERCNVILNENSENLDDDITKQIVHAITKEGVMYGEDSKSFLGISHPELFLKESVPEEIRNKFYTKKLTLDDFSSNLGLIDLFDEVNVVYGFSSDVFWISNLFEKEDNIRMANYNRLKVIIVYNELQGFNKIKEHIIEASTNFDMNKFECILEVIKRICCSNSSEIFTFKNEILEQVLNSSDPLDAFEKIENIFMKNNTPIVGKIFCCFEILHPNFREFDGTYSNLSPVLKNTSDRGKRIIIFSDLIRISAGSNNRSMNEYLRNIEFGSKIYESIQKGQFQYEKLDNEEKKELEIFYRHLVTIYNNTMKGKKENGKFKLTGDILTDILELAKRLSPNGSLDYNLGDRIISMFCGFIGIDKLEQVKEYISKKIEEADARNRYASRQKMKLEEGDFIKGIRDIGYLKRILQNGSVAKEYLGSSFIRDMTPLDTDLSMIMSSEGTIEDKISHTIASGYGPIWFVLKKDDRFITTRSFGEIESQDLKMDVGKLETFSTNDNVEDHYGIRTGFASSEINYIVMDSYDPRVGLEIAMNGFYIPICDKTGEIIFTPEMYDKIREKMSGLSYYGSNDYKFSNSLVTDDVQDIVEEIERKNYIIAIKREKINQIIAKSLEELGLYLKTNMDGDLTADFVELIDTGSTDRGTNKPGEGDFDFIMRLDRSIILDPIALNKLKQVILKNLGKDGCNEIFGGNFRLKGVQIDDKMMTDIDITFITKTDKISYSTDMALKDRLATIQKNDPEKYKYVIANIVLAKEVLKKAGVYKPERSDSFQGGLGGVGIENWILQNGGSFIDAALSFVEEAEKKTFLQFKQSYQVWDFGSNHFAGEKEYLYPHDNFVSNNMNEKGYVKMVNCLKEYLMSNGLYKENNNPNQK